MLIQQFNSGTVGEDSAAVSTELVPDTTEHLHQNKRHMKKSSAYLCFTEMLAANVCSGRSAAVEVQHWTRTQNRLQTYLSESRLVLIQMAGKWGGESKITHLAESSR